MSIANALKAVLVVMTLSAIGFAAAFMYEYRMNRTLRKEMAASTTTLICPAPVRRMPYAVRQSV